MLTFFLAMVVGWFFREYIAMRTIKHIMRAAEQQENTEKKELRIKVEKSKDMFYVFNDETDQFIIQGTSREDIGRELMKIHPDTTFVIDPNNVEEVGFK